MKKRAICLLLAVLLAVSLLPVPALAADGDVAIDKNNFPDDNFRSFILDNFAHSGTDEKPYFTSEQIAEVKTINVSDTEISTMKGVERFTALTELDCSGNELTSLDVSKNTALKKLKCCDISITTLNLSKNTALTDLDCSFNSLKALDLSKNSKLVYLNCECNSLKALNVSKNTKLVYLDCSYNSLKALDLSKNTKLEALSCDENSLQALDVSKNTRLGDLDCSFNSLKALDVSKNTALRYLSCYSNSIKALDVRSNTALIGLYCDHNSLTALDVSRNTKLVFLCCHNNRLKALDVSRNTKLQKLVCENNSLTALDVRKNTALSDLSCYGNGIKTLDICKNPDLLQIYLKGEKTDTPFYIRYKISDNSIYVDRSVTVYTLPAPKVTTQPKGVMVKEGKIATFTVAAKGKNLTYQWYVRKNGSSTWKKVSGAKSAVLKVTGTAAVNGNQYRCKVSNAERSVNSEAATLTVQLQPRIVTQPKNAAVQAGKTATFKLKATGGKLKYQWFRQKPGSSSWCKAKDGTKASLKVTAKLSMDGYRFRCLVYNDIGKVYSHAVKLKVTK